MSITQKKGSSNPAQALPHRLRDQLRFDILTGALPAGTPLKQDELAARFQASRIPVREALRQLETEGLVALCGARRRAEHGAGRPGSLGSPATRLRRSGFRAGSG
ncbi:hypothetical protein G6F60_014776 [Rhizopus arrhizus]|nr:hypothetical protein G6F60_014776 [Rhizopus arrhizus]